MLSDLPPIGPILEHYGGVVPNSTGQRNIKCPFHHDTHASAGVNFRDNIFNCFTCGVKGNSLQIIASREGVSIREAATIAEGITGESRVELHGKYSSGSRLPSKQRDNQGSSANGAIRRSRTA